MERFFLLNNLEVLPLGAPDLIHEAYMGKPQQIKKKSNIVVLLSYISLSPVFILLPDIYS